MSQVRIITPGMAWLQIETSWNPPARVSKGQIQPYFPPMVGGEVYV